MLKRLSNHKLMIFIVLVVASIPILVLINSLPERPIPLLSSTDAVTSISVQTKNEAGFLEPYAIADMDCLVDYLSTCSMTKVSRIWEHHPYQGVDAVIQITVVEDGIPDNIFLGKCCILIRESVIYEIADGDAFLRGIEDVLQLAHSGITVVPCEPYTAE